MEERKCNFFSLQSGMTQRCLHNFLLIFIPNERFSINRKRWLDAGKIKILYKIGNMRKKKIEAAPMRCDLFTLDDGESAVVPREPLRFRVVAIRSFFRKVFFRIFILIR